MDFSLFDNSFDIVIVYDENGVIKYGNSAFYLFASLTPARVVNKLDLKKIFYAIDEAPLNLSHFTNIKEATSIKVVSFKSKNNENGLGQYAIVPVEKNMQILFFKDLTIEEDLHRKYRREMSLKDKKIEEMDSLIELLQSTRLVKEPRKIIEEFIKHLLNHFGIGIGFLKDLKGEMFKVVNPKQIGLMGSYMPLMQRISQLESFKKYASLEGSDLQEQLKTFYANLYSLVIIPIYSQGKDCYEVFIPLATKEKAESFDHQKVITLAEQMKLLIQNMVLEKLSIFDDLTKLHNSRFFREKLNEYTNHFEKLNLILLDIDFFKKINDSYGHPGGDAVLIEVGQILKSYQDKEILVSRVGGEEFAILVPDQTLDETLNLASKISEQIKKTVIPFDGKDIKITMSFGISNWNPEKFSVRDFYKKADEALYESKANGRDRITIL
ncbi:MAG: GGDEF domain-containing protein, partial [Bdellovibrionales bacterium]|nr:GGDEF domain-containing protein [Bdellovibrionales bacterium]